MIEHVELVVNSVESLQNLCIIDVQVIESSQVEFPIKFGIGLDENWVFGVKNRTSRQEPVITRHGEQSACHGELSVTESSVCLPSTRHGELLCNIEQCLLAFCSPLQVSRPRGELFSSCAPFSCSCVVSTCFYFGLVFGVYMRVLGNTVSSKRLCLTCII